MKKIQGLILCFVLLVTAVAGAQEFRVSDIQIEGNRRLATAAIRGAVTINPGDVVTMTDVDRDMHRIFALGGLTDVSVRLTDFQGGNILTFVVQELPLIRRLEFSGNRKLKDDKLQGAIPFRVPFIFSPSRVTESVEALEALYEKDGYHAISVETDLQVDNRGEATLVYRINEGPKIRIQEIKFTGNTVLSKRQLLKNMETKEKWIWSWMTGRGTYLEDVLAIDVERIRMAYHDIGYQDVIVMTPQVSLVADKQLHIAIEIEEGPKYRTGNISVSGDMLYAEEHLLTLIKLKPGDVFSRLKLRESVLALSELYADSGYAYVNVVPLTSRDTEKLLFDLDLEIEQGPQVTIERIDITGNTKTRDKVIRREIPLIEGELYSSTKINETYRRVRNLGFFDEVQVMDRPGSAEDTGVVEVAVEERPTGTFSIGLGYSSVDKLMAQGSVTQDNFLGRGWSLALSGSFGSVSKNYMLSLTDPYFLDTEWTVGAEIYSMEREYRDYDEERTGGALRAGHPVSQNSRVFFTYRYEQKEIYNLSETGKLNRFLVDEEGKSTLSSITTQWVRNSTDFHDEPSRGGITRVSLEYAGLGGTEHFVRPIASHRHFFPLFWGTVFSVHGEVGYIKSLNNDEVPLSERFFLGGISTLRGFKSREVGPIEGDVYRGGEKMGYFNFEYLFPVYRSMGLQGVLFYDTGNAWLDNEQYFSDMRHSVGAGIRWRSPLGPLRFEWGYNLSPRDREKRSVFEFTIGRSF